MTNLSSTDGDVWLFQTPDDGEMLVENGIAQLTGGFETAAYLSLFGGNEEDDGRPNNPKTWWGNLDEDRPEYQYRSETQYLLRSIPAIPANLNKLRDASTRDLAWFITVKAASDVAVVVSMPALNKIKFKISIDALGEIHQFEFIENWMVSI